MRIVLHVFATLFLLLALGATTEAFLAIAAFHAARESGAVSRDQFVLFAVQMSFSWLFVSLYAALGWAFWRRRKLRVVTFFLVALVVLSWLGTIYHKTAILLAFAALLVLLAPRARALFRD